MKLLQKTALATAIAAAPFLSAQALEALDDSVLSEMTGQAGVTIETTVDGTKGITIGEITYTDTTGTDAVGGGSLVITGVKDKNGVLGAGITVQGQVWNETDGKWEDGNSSTIQTIDIDAHGNLITETVAGTGAKNIGTSADPVNVTAQKVSIGQVLLRSADQKTAGSGGAQLVSNLSMTQESGDSKAHILNLNDAAAVTAYKSAAYAISGTAVDNGLDRATSTDAAWGGKKANIAIVTQGSSRISNLDVDALDGAVQVRGLSYGGGADGTELMESKQVIWAIGGKAVDGGGVYIQGSDSTGTLNITSVGIGGGTIGSVQISNINQAGSVTRIYGH